MAMNRGSGAPKKEIELAPLACGLVLFDHQEDATTGTAYLPESHPQRIRSANDLRNDVVWVSNLYASNEKVRAHPTLRSGFYFRIPLAELAHDIGIQSASDSQMSPDDALQLSVMMTRTMTIAARAYGWDVAESGPLRVQEAFLMNDIKKMLPAAPEADARFRDSITHALTQAFQEVSVPDWPKVNYEPDAIFATLRFNRVNYARQILSHPLPTGRNWVALGADRIEGSALEFCLSRPSLAKVTIEWDNAAEIVAVLAAFGQAGRRRNPIRLWVTQPELKWLSQYARVSITDVWFDDAQPQRLSDSMRLPELFRLHPESALSYSAGLVAYSHFQAVCSTTWTHRHGIRSNVWATWISALDRAMMFSIALKAYDAGFHVDRYGAGAIRLRCPRDRLGELMAFKEENGLSYPDLASIAQAR